MPETTGSGQLTQASDRDYFLTESVDLAETTRPKTPKVTNIVALGNLNTTINLRSLAVYGINVVYKDCEKSLWMEIRGENKSKARVFESGKIVVVGCKSEELARISGKWYTNLIRRANKKCMKLQHKGLMRLC